VFDRFDDHALAALQDAQAQAIGLGHNYVGTEHLLLGIVINPDTTASHLLTAAGVDAEVIRRGIAKVVPIPDRPFRDPAPLLSTLGIDLDEVRRRAESTFGADTVRRVAVQEAQRRRRDRRFRFRRCVPIAPRPPRPGPPGLRWASRPGPNTPSSSPPSKPTSAIHRRPRPTSCSASSSKARASPATSSRTPMSRSPTSPPPPARPSTNGPVHPARPRLAVVNV
jgi:hypothetical protein